MIPCCFHPTRVVIVTEPNNLDDLLNSYLPRSHMTFDSFDSPMHALQYVNEVYQPNPFYDRYKQNTDILSAKKSNVPQKFLDTHREIYRPDRFDEISTVVIENTPEMSKQGAGDLSVLEFLEKIKHPSIQKILLVQEGDDEIAAQAMSSGFAQHVIYKDELDWEENLYDALQEAQWAYFTRLSEIFMSSIPSGVVKEFAIDDPNFQRFFKTILTNYGFTEAYICETSGSYLFLDDQAQDHGLVVNLAEQLDQWVRTGKDKGVNHPLLKDLKNRTKMMCYHTPGEELEPDKSHWDIYAHPAQKIKGERSTYYYAFAPNLYDIDVERVLPFEEYRETQLKKPVRVH